MKRFSIFFAALFAAVSSFGAITYELNGGVQSTIESPQAMYDSLNAIWNAASGTTTTWGDLATLKADVAKGIPTSAAAMDLTFLENEAFKAAFGWLATYMDAKCAEQGQTIPSTNASFLRYNLQAFFIDGVRASWPKSADYTTCGVSTVDAYQPYWKSGFANPTEPTAEVTLYAPYKEGATFDGWYATADFSGDKVTTVNAETTGTLYAKWVEYIPTVAEVKEMADNTETKVSGVVNFISGKNIYIQDATGGVLVFTTEDPTCKVGDKIVAKGVKVMYGGAPEVKNAVVESAEAATVFPATSFETLAPLVEDSINFKYFATNVTIAGVTIAEYDSYNNPTVQDAAGTKVKCYKMVLDSTAYPVGCKVTVTAVAAWYNGFQFVGDAAGIVRPIAGKKENYTFPTRKDGKYSLENNWVISNIEDNFAANKPGSTDYVRGMAAKDGIMYFINRETMSIIRIDGKTGDMLDPIKLQGTDTLFMKASVDSTGATKWSDATTLPYNDLKFDQAGNCLIGACMTGATVCQTFFIYVVDLETGACTKLIEDVLWENVGLNEVKFRFDAFGVAGDVKKDGVIMAADANGSWDVYRWLIKDGVAGEGERVPVLIDPAVDQSLFVNAAGFGTAPQIFPQIADGTLFYVDGFNTLPMLFYGEPKTGANLIDDFINVPTGTKVWNTDTISMNYGHNGLIEFQVGEEYFLLMAATNTAGSPTSAFALYKFADADRAFEGLEPLWYFPHNGLGNTTNGCRTAVPSVDVVSETEATLYIYANNNGYAAYTLKIAADNTAVEDIEAVKVEAKKVIENGQVYIIKNEVKYNVLGAEVK